MDTHEVITAARPADEAAGQPSALRAVLPSAFVIVVYVLLGIVAFWPVFPGISQRLFSAEGDYAQSVWYLDWISHAIAHGLNPFFSSAIDVPTGVNLAQNTESPLLGLITAPFAPVLSPVVQGEPALMLLAMPASATAAFVVLRKWRVWRPGGSNRGADLWLLSLHGGPGHGPCGTDLSPAAAVHRVDDRLHHGAFGIAPATRDPARPPGGGPVPRLTRGARDDCRLHDCGTGVRCDPSGETTLPRWRTPQ